MKTCSCTTYGECYENKCTCKCHSSKMKIKKECLDEQIIASYKLGQIKAYKKCLKIIDNLYHKLEKGLVWRESNDGVCDMCEEFIKKEIEKELKELDTG